MPTSTTSTVGNCTPCCGTTVSPCCAGVSLPTNPYLTLTNFFAYSGTITLSKLNLIVVDAAGNPVGGSPRSDPFASTGGSFDGYWGVVPRSPSAAMAVVWCTLVSGTHRWIGSYGYRDATPYSASQLNTHLANGTYPNDLPNHFNTLFNAGHTCSPLYAIGEQFIGEFGDIHFIQELTE